MRVRLDQVQEHPVTWTEEVPIEVADLGDAGDSSDALDWGDEGVLSLGPVRCRGEIERARGLTAGQDDRGTGSEQGFLVRMHLEYPETLSCFRCLEPTNQETAHDFEILVLADLGAESHGQRVEPSELELDEADLDVLRVHGEELDTVPLVLEQVRLNLPMKPLCSEDCLGLCSRCGANLNQGSCECPPPPADTRWSGLAALRDRLPSGPGDPQKGSGSH